ncbi:helix-turn-helix domain-containing protein [Notoacmeibacter sp. MSK16QG-6]|uniref:helix-turn-helix domain-containing protein n=1 Tax=Notoacmeibacter sp. MSK16QG-6 TaxID=2957982 RepID=UPI0020A1A21A|nr:helix-turn-helix domain-containing protein [Notoacmeibacter sp. MSK16QG-6]MCP1200065.1 helix-turn-helix domain-containing protein [Notoacmeibacter sp. MSK16QG-6]
MTEKSDVDPSVEGETDLFGAPINQVRERWGRPSYKKDKENQQFVALLAANGWPQERIARRIGCSVPTLRKNFFRELEAGRDMIEGDLLTLLFAKARAGNVGAIKQLREQLALVPPSEPRVTELKEEKLGKKEQMERDAGAPPESWAEALSPNGVAN